MKLNLIAFLVGGVLCTGATQAQGTIWTVDDDGPADFSQIADAIASPSVVDGDVLQVYSGNYANFVLDKSLSIVAKTGSSFTTGRCEVTDVEEFSISGMFAREFLTAANVSGRGRFDDCRTGYLVGGCGSSWPLYEGWARFTDCSDLVVTRCSLMGTDDCEFPDKITLEITSSTVAIVDSNLYGGWGYKYGGNSALSVWGQSDVTIAGSTLLAQGSGYWPIGAIVVGPDSVVRIRGSTDDRVTVLSGGFAVQADPAATVTVSGVALYPARPGKWVTLVDPPEPYLSVSGTDDAGGTKSVELYGPPGRLGLVLFSLVPALHIMAEDLDPLWLDPASLLMVVPLTTIDQETASSYSVYLPGDPALAGIALILQTWFPPVPHQRNFLTNPANIVLR